MSVTKQKETIFKKLKSVLQYCTLHCCIMISLAYNLAAIEVKLM